MPPPGPAIAIAAAALACAGMLAGGLLLGPQPGALAAMLLPQAAVLLPVILLLPWHGPRALGLAPPRPRDLAAGLLLAPAAALISLGANQAVVALAGGPPPQDLAVDRILAEARLTLGTIPLLLLVSLLPGLAEEALMRGVVLSGLRRRLSGGAAVAIAALVFAVMHLSPWRLAPQALLGLLAGWIALRQGHCWGAAGLHAGHNAVVLGLALAAQDLGATAATGWVLGLIAATLPATVLACGLLRTTSPLRAG